MLGLCSTVVKLNFDFACVCLYNMTLCTKIIFWIYFLIKSIEMKFHIWVISNNTNIMKD